MPFLAGDPIVASIATKHGVTATQVALSWLLHRSPRILLIPGTTSVAHLEENLATAKMALDAEDMTTLAEVEQAGTPMNSQ